MECPKCRKTLSIMQDKGFAFCPRKESVIRFGEPYNRKFRIELDPDSGCGQMFRIPLSERDELTELDIRYRSWKHKVGLGASGFGIKPDSRILNESGSI